MDSVEFGFGFGFVGLEVDVDVDVGVLILVTVVLGVVFEVELELVGRLGWRLRSQCCLKSYSMLEYFCVGLVMPSELKPERL